MNKQSQSFRPPIVAVVVTYNPDLDTLGRLVDACAPQVDSIVLVDNGDGVRLVGWLAQRTFSNVVLLPLGENRGIATAQNAGIDWALAKGAEYVLVFDHDSEPAPDLVVRLCTAFADLEEAGERVAAVGPRYTDSRRKKEDKISPFIRLENGRLIRCYPATGSFYVSVDFLISSGSLISIKALDAIGKMEDQLFIESVDVEWGLRARCAGWSLFGVWDAIMEHSLGDDHVMGMGRELAVHSPLRHYYLMRNALWLCRRKWLPRRWGFILAQNALKKFIAYSLFMPRPLRHFRFMCLGLWHAAHGRMGRL